MHTTKRKLQTLALQSMGVETHAEALNKLTSTIAMGGSIEGHIRFACLVFERAEDLAYTIHTKDTAPAGWFTSHPVWGMACPIFSAVVREVEIVAARSLSGPSKIT